MPVDLHFNGNTGLQSTIRGLHGTPVAPLPFLKGVVVRSFVLERPQGHVILYNSPGIDAAATDIRALGPIERLLLNHQHEAMFGAPDLEAPAYVHAEDEGRTDMPLAGTFSDRQRLGDDLEIIPTPGHTPGTTAFLWDSGDLRLLFPGDSIWVQGGEWKAVLLGDSDRAAYIASLSLLMDVTFDVLVPWGVEEGEPYGYGVSPKQARSHLDAIRRRLERGENA